ncbi:hypothetical protein SAMN05421846_106107 [Chryseobacterium taeanense]|uniref:Lipoprotein n=1 Tax=Chryseobacterium taeanense TaxID=311334 RepID=A0A1G8JLR6_9FLAO|nr:hypothetical protein [Chryseobacterium taeanense]SDI31590.1 hypothetical protein SAMN05421846_106107 [Chryseobacterium taeanense]
MRKCLIKILVISGIILLQGCKVQYSDLSVLQLKVQDIGKVCLNSDEKSNLSKISNIKRKYFTSAIYTTVDGKNICFPINDKTFDYNYYKLNEDNIHTKEIKIFYKIFNVNNKEIKVVYKINE